ATISRQSSASRPDAISVEPARSQNKTVRCRRSPSPAPTVIGALLTAAADASCGLSFAAGVGGDGAIVSGPAHPWQNLAVGRLVASQPGHCTTSGAEHSSQNRALSWFSEPQCEQRTKCLLLTGLGLDSTFRQTVKPQRILKRLKLAVFASSAIS